MMQWNFKQTASVDVQGDRGFDGVMGPKGTQGEKGERVSMLPAV